MTCPSCSSPEVSVLNSLECECDRCGSVFEIPVSHSEDILLEKYDIEDPPVNQSLFLNL